MALLPAEEKRLAAVEEKVEIADRRIDDLYRLVGQVAVQELKHDHSPPTPEAEPEVTQRRWYDQLPVKWIALWVCGIITLVLATYGFIRSDLLESLWHLLAGSAAAPLGQ